MRHALWASTVQSVGRARWCEARSSGEIVQANARIHRSSHIGKPEAQVEHEGSALEAQAACPTVRSPDPSARRPEPVPDVGSIRGVRRPPRPDRSAAFRRPRSPGTGAGGLARLVFPAAEAASCGFADGIRYSSQASDFSPDHLTRPSGALVRYLLCQRASFATPGGLLLPYLGVAVSMKEGSNLQVRPHQLRIHRHPPIEPGHRFEVAAMDDN